MDDGNRGLVLTSVRDPTKTTQFAEYQGNTFEICGSYGILYVDKVWNAQGKEIDAAPWRE